MCPAQTWWIASEGRISTLPRSSNRSRSRGGRFLFLVFCLLMFCASAASLRAALQFDVFLGYDGIVPEASWFPLVCEAKNDGPTFTGTVELTSGNQSQTRRVTVELPTGTLKRFVLPVFSSTAQSYSRWDVRLYDERGRVRAEQ